jgi:Alpha-L-fucosidase
MRLTMLAWLLTTASFSRMPVQADDGGDTQRRVDELRNLRWAMFVCWSFSTFSDKEWTPGIKGVSFFTPTGLDTDQWAATAKEAGMGYILFLTKHHDGFCLWDTETTDRKVTNSPGCFVGYNHGEPAGDLRLGEMGRPSPLSDPSGAGFNKVTMKGYRGYQAAEFTMPILMGRKAGRWFYTNPGNDRLAMPYQADLPALSRRVKVR